MPPRLRRPEMGELAFLQPAGLHSPRGYSHAVVSAGRLVHVAGQVALQTDGTLVGPGDVGAQAEQALANLELALASAEATFASVASLSIFVAAAVPHAELARLREPLRRRIGVGPPPAITLLFVHALMDPDWLVEVQAVAIAGTPVSASEKAMLELGA